MNISYLLVASRTRDRGLSLTGSRWRDSKVLLKTKLMDCDHCQREFDGQESDTRTQNLSINERKRELQQTKRVHKA